MNGTCISRLDIPLVLLFNHFIGSDLTTVCTNTTWKKIKKFYFYCIFYLNLAKFINLFGVFGQSFICCVFSLLSRLVYLLQRCKDLSLVSEWDFGIGLEFWMVVLSCFIWLGYVLTNLNVFVLVIWDHFILFSWFYSLNSLCFYFSFML